MGHVNSSTTERYIHPTQQAQQQAVEQYGNIIEFNRNRKGKTGGNHAATA